MKKWLRLVASIFACQLAGIIGSLFTSQSIPTWYATLQKPWFSPPNWVFGQVWITLYTLMGISLFWIWKKSDRLAISLFSFQLFLNAIWSIIFFGIRNPMLAFFEIIVLWIAILATIVKFYMIDKKSGIILLPYILWVTIATILNYYIWILN